MRPSAPPHCTVDDVPELNDVLHNLMIQSPSIGDAHDAGEGPSEHINNPVNRNIQGLYFFDA